MFGQILSPVVRRLAAVVLLAAMSLVGLSLSGAPALAQGADPAADGPQEFGDLTPQQQLQALILQGNQQMEAGNYEAAVQLFTVVVSTLERGGVTAKGSLPGPLLLRARAFTKLEEYQSAIDDLKDALQNAQATPQLLPEIQNARAEVYMQVGAYQLALPDLQEAVQASRSNRQYQFNYGKTLINLGGAEAADKALTKYLDLSAEAAAKEDAPEPTDEDADKAAEAYLLRAQARGGLRKFEEALADIATSLQIKPDNHLAYFTRAQIALQSENYEGAIADLREAIAKYTPADPEDTFPYADGYLFMASTYEEMGKSAAREGDDARAADAYATSEATCVELLDQAPEDDPRTLATRLATLFRKGVAERLQNELGDAVTSFSQVLEIDPNQGEAYFRRGICFHFLGEEKLAVRDFEQAASINFDSPRSNLWKGMSHARGGDYREAIRAYGESIAVSDRYTPAYVNRGLAHMALGNFNKAIDDFNEAIRLDPTEATHYFRRGKAQSLAGERAAAIKSFSNAIEFDPELMVAYQALADELDADGQTALAAEYRRRSGQVGQ